MRIAILWLLVLALWPRSANADSISADLEMAIHLKILSFDSGLRQRTSGNVIYIAVLYTPTSKGNANDFVNAVARLEKTGVTVHGKKVRAQAVPVTADLAERLGGYSVLYVIDEVGSGDVPAIAQIAFSRKLPLLSGERSYLASGAAIAVIEKANKPRIVVHAGNAKNCGMVLDSKLLRLAEVIK